MSTTNELLDSAKCIGSCIPQGMQLPVLINIFAEIANMSTTPGELMDSAKCYASCIPERMQLPVLIYLATQIATNLSNVCCLSGTGSPEGVETANPGSTYLDASNGFFYVKQTGVGNTGWLALVT